jgi:Rod binding domain-containing protein
MTSTPTAITDSTLLLDPQALAGRLRSQRAVQGARELEAALFSQVLEKMEKSFAGNADEDDAGHDSWTALGLRALSQGLAQHRLLGIAESIERSLGVASPEAGSVPKAAERQDKSAAELMSLKQSLHLPIDAAEEARDDECENS